MKKTIFGNLIIMEGIFLALTTGVSLFYGEGDWSAFLITTLICFIVGIISIRFGYKDRNTRMGKADSFLVVALTWVVFSIIGCIPFVLYNKMDIASAYFETMSGFTTTGATCIPDIDGLTHGIKFWRSVTQWMGGLGIVVFSIALIPTYEMKNSTVFSAEVTGISLDKLRPKIGSTARRLLLIYLFLSLLCALCYWIGPMDLFDAICHSMTTIATGGYSTHTASMGYFHSSYIEYICPIFMIASGINFNLYYYVTIGRSKVLFKNEEVRAYLAIVLLSIAIFVLSFYFAPISDAVNEKIPHGFEEIFRSSLFHVSSVITSTGFSAQNFDYVAWGPSFWMPTITIMAIGSCAGSTAGGMKTIRFLVCLKAIKNELILQLHPRAMLNVKVNGQILSNDRVRRTLSFVIIYLILVCIAMECYSIMGNDVDTALGSSISLLSNVGPGTGNTGPASNYAHILPAGKWLGSFYMLVGRLEIYTVLFLFMPNYWKERK